MNKYFDLKLTQVLNIMEKKGLFYNINKRKKSGKSRSKKDSTIDPKTYKQMKNW